MLKFGSIHRAGLVSAISLVSVAAPAQVEPGQDKAVVQIIDRQSVKPLLGVAPWIANGPAEHRRVVNRQANGSVDLDIGYNTYAKGVRLSSPYAYRTDEVCYIQKGRIRMQSDGEPVVVTAGQLMWRPAGAATQWVDILEDSVSICAMAPARLDANSHRLPPEEVGKWSGNPAKRPVLHWFDVHEASVVTPSDPSAGVIEREILSYHKDGSARMSVDYIDIKPGGHFVTGRTGEQICWLEHGTARMTANGTVQPIATGNFVYRPNGAKIDRFEAGTSAGLICFSGPAAR